MKTRLVFKYLQKSIRAVLLLSLFLAYPVFGQTSGFNTTSLLLSINGSSTTYFDLQAVTSNPDFNGLNLGSFCKGSNGIVFKGAECNNYTCGSCSIASCQIYYRVYLTSGTPGSFVSKSISFVSSTSNTCGGSAQVWSTNTYSDTIIAANNLTPGNYTFEVYTTQQSGCSGQQYANNSGANYKAYFSVLPNVTYYQDADNDTYGNPLVSQVSCTGAPAGYQLNNTDCDDTKIAIHPNALEVCNDGLDDDCNGVVDNVGQPGGCVVLTTSLVAGTCGSTLATIDSPIYANIVSYAQGYRWKVTKVVNGVPSTLPADTQYFDTLLRSFRISQLSVFAYDTSYMVSVCVNYNGVWLPNYSTPCMVTTPIGTTKVTAIQCGITLATMADVIYADIVPYATGYRFKLTNLLNPTDVQYVDRLLREFRFSLLTSVFFMTPYKVEISVRNTNGVYMPYGLSCVVTTPFFPTTQLQSSQCDYYAGNMADLVYANIVANSTMYRFNITSTSLGYAYMFDSPSRVFQMSAVPGLLLGNTYTVQVAVQINGIVGPYGKSCTITTPDLGGKNSLRKDVFTDSQSVGISLYPNPFTSSFQLQVNEDNTSTLSVKVYDLLGRLIDAVESYEPQSELGGTYPSGVYNVIVTQGDSAKTLRVIKR